MTGHGTGNHEKKTSVPGIIEAINGFFQSGIIINRDVSDYARSGLGITGTHEIISLISDPDAYGEGLVDLVFVPDLELRGLIEPLVPQRGMDERDIRRIAAQVSSGLKETEISFREPGDSAIVPLRGIVIQAFIRRLRLSRSVPFSLTSKDKDMPCTAIIKARIMVRMSGYTPFAGGDDILRRLLYNFPASSPNEIVSFPEALAFMLQVMSEYPDSTDFFSMISSKKRLLLKSLQRAEDFESRISRFSMDYLMSRRITPSAVDREMTGQEIRTADMVCRVLYGKPAEPGMPEQKSVIDIESIDTHSIEDIIRFLS